MFFQNKFINKSNLSLGNVALTQTKKKAIVNVLNIMIKDPNSEYKQLLTLIPKSSKGIGEPQPDQNSATNKKDIDSIFKYSPKKKKAKGKEAYSTL